MKTKLFALIGLILLTTACAHHRDVRPGANNVHRVVVRTDDEGEGSRNAIDQANHFCDSRRDGAYAVFLKEDSKYTGDLDESTYKNGKRVAKVAQVVGGGVWGFGGKGARTAGGVVGLGGAAGDAALGDGYTVDMRFKCR